MKKEYEEPKLEIEVFETTDICTLEDEPIMSG